MGRTQTDIFVSGAGLAGLTMALAMTHAGKSVIVGDPAPAEAADADIRSTAILQPAQALFESLGAWDMLAPLATPLNVLRVGDCDGDPPVIKTVRSFASSDLGDKPFGWNLPNAATRHVLIKLLKDSGLATLKLGGGGFRSIVTRDDEVRVQLEDKTRLAAQLAIAADGRTSPLREAAGIQTTTTRYGQKAIVCVVSHPLPHENVSIELYLHGGAFTLVPMPDHDGIPASAIVWMNDGPYAQELMTLDADAFSRASTLRSCDSLGPLTLVSKRHTWPVITQSAERLTARRTALIAEAAHVMPPIGAQGLNTSLNDVRALYDCILGAEDPGAKGVLDQYAKARQNDIDVRVRAIDLFNRLCQSDSPVAHGLRQVGLSIVHDVTPLRRGVMRAGLGAA